MNDECWLFVDAAASFGGHEVMLLRWLNELRLQRRITPVLLARSNTRLYEQATGKVTTFTLPAPVHNKSHSSFFIKCLHSVRDAYRLIKLTLQLKPALAVVAEGCLLSHAGFTLLLRIMQLPTVVYVPLVEPSTSMGFGRGALRDWLMRTFYSRIPQAWITLTPQQALQFSAWARVTKPVFNLPNTVDEMIERTGTKPTHTQHPIRVLVLGRFDAHQKGIDSLLDFLTDRIELSNDMHISLVGDGPYEPEITRRLNAVPLLQRLISIHQWSPAIDVLREHDVLLLPSRYEGVPLVMLEAMAMGVPVIASNLPGTRALLPNECLFTVGDYEHAMRLILSSAQPEWRVAIVQRNHEAFSEHASGAAFSKAVEHLTDLLSRLTRQPPHPYKREQSNANY